MSKQHTKESQRLRERERDRERMQRQFVYLSLLSFLLVFVDAVRNLRIVSPIQSLTIFDPEIIKTGSGSDEVAEPTKPLTHRRSFLTRFKAGLEAETAARKATGIQRKQRLQIDASKGNNDEDWAKRAASAGDRLRENEANAVERAYDESMMKFNSNDEAIILKKRASRNENKYQFVGVINPPSTSGKKSNKSNTPITWYARKKPPNSNWSVRLVHVNKDAIVKDLYDQRKIDIFAKYDNTGRTDIDKNQPIVTSEYSVRERSWK